MKAVIMAGGEGVRLRPLTCDRPKPLATVGNRPVLAYCLELVRRYGVAEVHLTLGYKAQAILDSREEWQWGLGGPGAGSAPLAGGCPLTGPLSQAGGIPLAARRPPPGGAGDGGRAEAEPAWGRAPAVVCHVEQEPLGTAGGVAALRDHLRETFLVLSGDALTDLDLAALVAFHRRVGALATLALYRVTNPLAYGVVLTDGAGRVRRFVEKPGPGEAFSDTVNAGIYVLEPEVLRWVPAGVPFDFSRDLFPRLLAAGAPVYGWVAGGYWCDIGDVAAYLQANLDLLAGRVAFAPPGRPVAPGLWLEEGAEIAEGVEIDGPALLGAGARVGRGARLAGGVVLGPGSLVAACASLKRCVLGRGACVGARAEVRGAVLADGAALGPLAAAYEGVVMGAGARVGQGATLRPEVRIWPAKRVPAGATVAAHVVWGSGPAPVALPGGRLVARLGVDLLPEEAVRLGAAVAAALPPGPVVAGCAASAAARLLRDALAVGLAAAGRQVWVVDGAPAPAVAWAIPVWRAAGGIYAASQGDALLCLCCDGRGLPAGPEVQRRVAQALARDGLPRAGGGATAPRAGALEEYLDHLAARLDCVAIARRRFRVRLALPEGWEEAAAAWADRLGVDLAGAGGDLAAQVDPLGLAWWLVDPGGRPLGEAEMWALAALLEIHQPQGEAVVLPDTAPRALLDLCHRHGRRVTQVPAATWYPGDPLLQLGRLLQWLATRHLTVADVLATIPPLPVACLTVPCPWDARPHVLRRLAEEHGAAEEAPGSLRMRGSGATAVVLPDPALPVYRVYAEGDTAAAAAALAERVGARVAALAQEV